MKEEQFNMDFNKYVVEVEAMVKRIEKEIEDNDFNMTTMEYFTAYGYGGNIDSKKLFPDIKQYPDYEFVKGIGKWEHIEIIDDNYVYLDFSKSELLNELSLYDVKKTVKEVYMNDTENMGITFHTVSSVENSNLVSAVQARFDISNHDFISVQVEADYEERGLEGGYCFSITSENKKYYFISLEEAVQTFSVLVNNHLRS
ncbi:hypothetical protein E1N66_18790 [Pantoea allii]|nr:hypothetical protein [Pantoea allii]THB82851.1 hypothetical protein E1N66_18790 [Pantoea allii]